MSELKFAYLILAHKNTKQVALLVDTLLANSTCSYCFIHFDKVLVKNSDITSFKKCVKSKRYVILRKRESLTWGGFSIVDATLKLMIESINFDKQDFDYFMLLSGQDLPIKGTAHMNVHFTNNFGKQFIECEQLPRPSWGKYGGMNRYIHYWFIDDVGLDIADSIAYGQQTIGQQKELPLGIKNLYGGSQWWSLTYKCVEFIINYLNDHPIFTHFFKYTCIPDECFFHTLLMNSDFSESIFSDDLRYLEWSVKPSHPRILTIDDFQNLANSNDLIARKFDTNVDEEIVNKILEINSIV